MLTRSWSEEDKDRLLSDLQQTSPRVSIVKTHRIANNGPAVYLPELSEGPNLLFPGLWSFPSFIGSAHLDRSGFRYYQLIPAWSIKMQSTENQLTGLKDSFSGGQPGSFFGCHCFSKDLYI